MDRTPNPQLRQQDSRRRPGRPRFADSIEPQPEDDMQSKKTRQRLAQRSYRSRKETALTSARARAAELEASLAKAVQSFNQFHRFVAGRNGESLPSDVLLQLTKTASDLAAISQISRPVDDNDQESFADADGEKIEKQWRILNPESSPLDLRWYEKQQSVLDTQRPVAHRFHLACIDRALKLFSVDNRKRKRPDLVRDWSGLVLLNPLIILENHNPGSLHKLTTIHMGGINRGYWVDALYEPRIHEGLPMMFRTIEGRSDVAVRRLSPPKLQSLGFGRTRTVLRTEIQELQGEWLEPTDVEEYLSERGIYVRNGSPSDKIVLALPTAEDQRVERIEVLSEGVTELESSAVEEVSRFNNSGTVGAELHERWKEYSTADSTFQLPDSTIFGVSQGSFTEIPSGTWSFTPSPSQYNGLLGMETPSRVTGGNNNALPSITVDIDKLVSILAAEAACLGPGPGVRRAIVDLAIRESLTIVQ